MLLVFLVWGKAQSPALQVGDTVPSFRLEDQDGHLFDLSDYVGKKILVIYFYPKDESPVCTIEACAFRDDYSRFTQAGALVIGINSGTVQRHKSFHDHQGLPFVLLSDPQNLVLKRFGVKRSFLFTGRETFVVDLRGKIAFTYSAFTQGEAHAEKALQVVKQLALPG